MFKPEYGESKWDIIEEFDRPVWNNITDQTIENARSSLLPMPKNEILSALGKLAIHKRYNGGDARMWALYSADCAEELKGFGGGVILETLRRFKFDTSSPWFPTLADLFLECDILQEQMMEITGQAKEPPPRPEINYQRTGSSSMADAMKNLTERMKNA